jgi:hypothetical protein
MKITEGFDYKHHEKTRSRLPYIKYEPIYYNRFDTLPPLRTSVEEVTCLVQFKLNM